MRYSVSVNGRTRGGVRAWIAHLLFASASETSMHIFQLVSRDERKWDHPLLWSQCHKHVDFSPAMSLEELQGRYNGHARASGVDTRTHGEVLFAEPL